MMIGVPVPFDEVRPYTPRENRAAVYKKKSVARIQSTFRAEFSSVRPSGRERHFVRLQSPVAPVQQAVQQSERTGTSAMNEHDFPRKRVLT